MTDAPPNTGSELLESRFTSTGGESELWVPRALERLRRLLGQRALHAAQGLHAARVRAGGDYAESVRGMCEVE